MKSLLQKVSGLAILLILGSGIPANAEQARALSVPVSGIFVASGEPFAGTATITRFEKRGTDIYAIGAVRNSSGTAFAGVAWLVTPPKAGSFSMTGGQAPAAPHVTRSSWSPNRGSDARLVQVQGTTGCGVLNISLGATSVNLA